MASLEPDLLAVVGRERELATVGGLVHATSPRALLLVGSPGIGKTTLWEAGVAAAMTAGARVLSARPSDVEASLAFAGLIDLCDGVEAGELAELAEAGALERAVAAGALVVHEDAVRASHPLLAAAAVSGSSPSERA